MECPIGSFSHNNIAYVGFLVELYHFWEVLEIDSVNFPIFRFFRFRFWSYNFLVFWIMVATRVNFMIYNALVTVIHTDYCTPVYVILTVIGTLWTDQWTELNGKMILKYFKFSQFSQFSQSQFRKNHVSELRLSFLPPTVEGHIFGMVPKKYDKEH